MRCKRKLISPVKRYQTTYEFKKAQKSRTPYLIAWEENKKTIKVLKVLRVKYAPVTDMAKGITWFITTDVC